MHQIFKILLLGLAAGILDVIPMAFQSLDWQSIVAVLVHWLGLSIIIAYARIPLSNWASGMLISGLTALPIGILVHSTNPGGILQVLVFSLILGGLLGYMAERLVTDQP
ncbi:MULTISPECIES: hypothetical protein [unclassified Pseudodesulfovibrio]|uniref:hypothetical protein n=1 Tax=unclassified Pseudodesulfovibrio TaxID=2661612 RepID=UPI000FEC046D|nr:MULTISPECIES: hypothetical protein [unclassified Pseudodesulfovibrio]MCJ2163108.1 hypothetical protein [Pseudodesulfovibrio sp. S3-i]RWU07100.1 hypothetical protein DWB63_00925 [Pseudodesulfovibrio sp. S3]